MDLENTSSFTNGLFGVKSEYENSQLVIMPTPWEVTASYGKGAALGPEAVLTQSPQIDLFDLDSGYFIKKGVYWDKEFYEGSGIKELNEKFKPLAQNLQSELEEKGQLTDTQMKIQDEINKASLRVNELVYERAQFHLRKKKNVALLGGDHSGPLGLVKAYSEIHSEYSVLHIDAHADLREAYQGFENSHASIMTNILKLNNKPQKLVQVGIRDFCESEFSKINHNDRISCFFDQSLKEHLYQGKTWDQFCENIIDQLNQNVYISFDIDGLSPDLCPNTGTPVPGGLSFEMMSHLLKKLKLKNKSVIGFDLCEVAPGENNDTWDGNVGARVLFKLCGSVLG